MSLAGRRILITRTRHQASELQSRLEAAGAETILIPTIELAAPSSFCALDAALASVASFDWLIFTSANAVRAFDARARALALMPSPRRIAVIGPATARAVEQIGLTVDLIPQQYVAESLAAALEARAQGSSMLLVRAEEARDVLPELLAAAGAEVTIANAYRNVVPLESIASLQMVFADASLYPDAVTFTSSSTATNLFALLDKAAIKLPRGVVRASIGPITSRTLRDLGWPPTIEAGEPTISALCEALAEHFGQS